MHTDQTRRVQVTRLWFSAQVLSPPFIDDLANTGKPTNKRWLAMYFNTWNLVSRWNSSSLQPLDSVHH